jgi:hypothetical protein
MICGLLCAIAVLASDRAPAPPASPAWISISSEELRDRYDTLWAVSDVHGRLEQLERLLLAAGLAVRDADEVRWRPAHPKQLLVIVGDSIRGGPDSRGVVLLLKKLQQQAAGAGSRVVVLLGNHEISFLTDPLRSGEDEYSRFIRAMPVAAFVGSWLFAHAGYVEVDDDVDALRGYFARAGERWEQGEYGFLLQPHSILEYHGWWKSERRRSRLKKRLAMLGLNGLVFGHDPDALGARRTIAMDKGGWLTKLDTGLKENASQGMMLRCELARLLRGLELAMSDEGRPTCRALMPNGSLHEIPVH